MSKEDTEAESDTGSRPTREAAFTPGSYPRANFVSREAFGFDPDEPIRWALKSGAVVQLVGPPDSGKTSLARHLLADRPLLVVRGGDVHEHDDVARQLFDELVTKDSDTNDGDSTVPAALRPTAERIDQVRDQPRDQLRVVNSALEAGEQEIAVLYDDFDAIPEDLQTYVAQLLKGQYERGVDVFVTADTSGSDDLFRANSDLRGRVRTVDVPAWEGDALTAIARRGFATLGVDVKEETIGELAERADGSPTAMHRLCLALLRDRDATGGTTIR